MAETRRPDITRDVVVSGMRPTGALHLGHYHGVVRHWIELQQKHTCYFFVADWHALTTHYNEVESIAQDSWNMVVDWLALGVNPEKACLFIQSHIQEHAELHVLLSMLTPLSWLERMPSYKDQQIRLKDKDLSTYGFLGYPLLMSADVLVYGAHWVPVGEDQLAHLELSRELARRFNDIYGRSEEDNKQARRALKKLESQEIRQRWEELVHRYRQQGAPEIYEQAQNLLTQQKNLSPKQRQLLFTTLSGSGRAILQPPQGIVNKAAKMPGLDGQKMSKSYGNTISLREPIPAVEKKLRSMPTDPARVRRNDPGEPQKCPVWSLHKIYSDEATLSWVDEGCRSAEIGCIDCKGPLISAIKSELSTIQGAIDDWSSQADVVQKIIDRGNEQAREAAQATIKEVRRAMGLRTNARQIT